MHSFTSSTEPKPKRAFKGVWIDKNIWETKELTWFQKCLLAEIDSLDDGGGCFASNEYLADHFDSTSESIRVSIFKLKSSGWIVDMTPPKGREKMRHLSIARAVTVATESVTAVPVCVAAVTKTSRPIIKEIPEEKKEERDASLTFNLGEEKTSTANSNEQAVEILEHLNEKAERKFLQTGKTIRLIQNRLKDVKGDVAGIKKMIDRQCSKWKGDLKMEDYLRPKTLFNGNFDDYYGAKDAAYKSAKPAPEPIDYSNF